MKPVDTRTRHVTKPGATLLAEPGFDKVPTGQYYEASEKQINDLRALKEQLMTELASWIKENNLKQEQAAEILHITRPRVSDVVNLKFSKFTIDTLVELLGRTGKPVKFVIG